MYCESNYRLREEGIPLGLKRVLKKCDCGPRRESPGLKPIMFVDLFRRAEALRSLRKATTKSLRSM
jgi:hypothetical protein